MLVELENSSALAEAIAFLLTRPKTTQRDQAARQRAQQAFHGERCVNASDDVFQKFVMKRQGKVITSYAEPSGNQID